MDNINNFLNELSTLDFETLDDLVNKVNDKLQIAIAIFDANNMIQYMSMEMHRCKCYYILLHKYPNQCSMFEPAFAADVLSKDADQDTLCDYGCRLTLRIANIQNLLYKIVMFQYNLYDDDLSFNPANNPNYIPLYHGNDATTVDYFWKPNLLSIFDRSLLFDFMINKITKIINKC